MSAVIIGASDMVWGVQSAKPLRGFPDGKVRIRVRSADFAQAFVKTRDGIRHFYIQSIDGFWQPKFEQGSNHREVIS